MSVAFGPHGKRIVSGSQDGTLNIWDALTGQETLTLRGLDYAASSVAFSPGGKRIVSGSLDGTMKVWDVSSSLKSRHARPIKPLGQLLSR